MVSTIWYHALLLYGNSLRCISIERITHRITFCNNTADNSTQFMLNYRCIMDMQAFIWTVLYQHIIPNSTSYRYIKCSNNQKAVMTCYTSYKNAIPIMPKTQTHPTQPQNKNVRTNEKPKYTFPPHFVSGSARSWVIALLVQKS